jgi:hypothetical protein
MELLDVGTTSYAHLPAELLQVGVCIDAAGILAAFGDLLGFPLCIWSTRNSIGIMRLEGTASDPCALLSGPKEAALYCSRSTYLRQHNLLPPCPVSQATLNVSHHFGMLLSTAAAAGRGQQAVLRAAEECQAGVCPMGYRPCSLHACSDSCTPQTGV